MVDTTIEQMGPRPTGRAISGYQGGVRTVVEGVVAVVRVLVEGTLGAAEWLIEQLARLFVLPVALVLHARMHLLATVADVDRRIKIERAMRATAALEAAAAMRLRQFEQLLAVVQRLDRAQGRLETRYPESSATVTAAFAEAMAQLRLLATDEAFDARVAEEVTRILHETWPRERATGSE